jgi:hypothetical protein
MIPFVEIGLVGLVIAMVYGSLWDRWSFMRHDLSLLGSRREKEGMKGTRLYRVKYPEIFNSSAILVAIGFIFQSERFGYPVLYTIAGYLLIAFAIIDVGTNQMVHVTLAMLVAVLIIIVTVANLINGDVFVPVSILLMIAIYMTRFFFDDVCKGFNTSVFQKFALTIFIFYSII